MNNTDLAFSVNEEQQNLKAGFGVLIKTQNSLTALSGIFIQAAFMPFMNLWKIRKRLEF